ncbi:hypothetical protein [Streptomyces hawaiiensis]|uniref:hypothetical protein n=1 Tax=Streptomyces hawaiiensis TaxID=67305 RepID=UPI003666A496
MMARSGRPEDAPQPVGERFCGVRSGGEVPEGDEAVGAATRHARRPRPGSAAGTLYRKLRGYRH